LSVTKKLITEFAHGISDSIALSPQALQVYLVGLWANLLAFVSNPTGFVKDFTDYVGGQIGLIALCESVHAYLAMRWWLKISSKLAIICPIATVCWVICCSTLVLPCTLTGLVLTLMLFALWYSLFYAYDKAEREQLKLTPALKELLSKAFFFAICYFGYRYMRSDIKGKKKECETEANKMVEEALDEGVIGDIGSHAGVAFLIRAIFGADSKRYVEFGKIVALLKTGMMLSKGSLGVHSVIQELLMDVMERVGGKDTPLDKLSFQSSKSRLYLKWSSWVATSLCYVPFFFQLGESLKTMSTFDKKIVAGSALVTGANANIKGISGFVSRVLSCTWFPIREAWNNFRATPAADEADIVDRDSDGSDHSDGAKDAAEELIPANFDDTEYSDEPTYSEELELTSGGSGSESPPREERAKTKRAVERVRSACCNLEAGASGELSREFVDLDAEAEIRAYRMLVAVSGCFQLIGAYTVANNTVNAFKYVADFLKQMCLRAVSRPEVKPEVRVPTADPEETFRPEWLDAEPADSRAARGFDLRPAEAKGKNKHGRGARKLAASRNGGYARVKKGNFKFYDGQDYEIYDHILDSYVIARGEDIDGEDISHYLDEDDCFYVVPHGGWEEQKRLEANSRTRVAESKLGKSSFDLKKFDNFLSVNNVLCAPVVGNWIVIMEHALVTNKEVTGNEKMFMLGLRDGDEVKEVRFSVDDLIPTDVTEFKLLPKARFLGLKAKSISPKSFRLVGEDEVGSCAVVGICPETYERRVSPGDFSGYWAQKPGSGNCKHSSSTEGGWCGSLVVACNQKVAAVVGLHHYGDDGSGANGYTPFTAPFLDQIKKGPSKEELKKNPQDFQ